MTCKVRGAGLENCMKDEVVRGGWGMVTLNPSQSQWRFQPWANPGIAWVKFWSIVVIAYHCIVLWDNWALGQRCPTVSTTDQSKLDS